jgi:hypothetical protein
MVCRRAESDAETSADAPDQDVEGHEPEGRGEQVGPQDEPVERGVSGV